MNKSFWIILGVALLALIGIFMLSGGKSSDNSDSEFAYTEPLTDVQSHDRTTGEGTKATIIEYADFQCPYCGSYAPIMEQLKQTYGDEVKVVFRSFPIVSIHPQAMAAHRAAEAAARQNKFWEMHDQIFATQETWKDNTGAATVFEDFAEKLGLNMDQYKADVASESVLAKINSDQDSGTSLGVNSTPTLFLNGKKLEDLPASIEEWDKLINPSQESSAEEAPAETE